MKKPAEAGLQAFTQVTALALALVLVPGRQPEHLVLQALPLASQACP